MLAKERKAQEEQFVERIVSLVGNGAISKACQQLTSDGVQDVRSPDIMNTLRSLHPEEEEPPRIAAHLRKPITFTFDEESLRERLQKLKKAIFSFPRESAPGPSGLKPDHVKEMLGEYLGAQGEFLLKSLDRFVCNAITKGIHPLVAKILCAARLTPLRKAADME